MSNRRNATVFADSGVMSVVAAAVLMLYILVLVLLFFWWLTKDETAAAVDQLSMQHVLPFGTLGLRLRTIFYIRYDAPSGRSLISVVPLLTFQDAPMAHGSAYCFTRMFSLVTDKGSHGVKT